MLGDLFPADLAPVSPSLTLIFKIGAGSQCQFPNIKFSGTEPEHFRILAVLLSSDFQHLPCSARPSTGLCYGKSGATCWASMPAQARNCCQYSACIILPCICPPPCL